MNQGTMARDQGVNDDDPTHKEWMIVKYKSRKQNILKKHKDGTSNFQSLPKEGAHQQLVGRGSL